MGTGTLYVCATPIGNLKDITLRVLEILEQVAYIAAEDTRHTIKLLNHYSIKTPLISYHEHNKKARGDHILALLQEGHDIALVSDAGMPGISDPGEDLIALCRKQEVPVTVLPGASAGITALVLSGFPTMRFVFEGFLPRNKKRKSRLAALKQESRTIVLYESPHHLTATLKDLYEVLGEREISCIKEMTKKYETVLTGTLSYMLEYFQETPPKGEFVLVLSALGEEELADQEAQNWDDWKVQEHLEYYLSQGLTEKEAMKTVAKDRKMNKRDVYKILKIDGGGDEN